MLKFIAIKTLYLLLTVVSVCLFLQQRKEKGHFFKKSFTFFFAIAAVFGLLTETGACQHTYIPDNCTEAAVCSKCEAARDSQEHYMVDASCKESAHCVNCSYKEGDPLGHLYESWSTIEPTCTTSGKRSSKCSRCNIETTEELDKLDHIAGTPKITKEATLETTGEKTTFCTLCNDVLKTTAYYLSKEDKQEIFSAAYNVDDLIDMLDSNAYKAEQTFQGKYIRLTGTVGSIDSDGEYFSLQPINQWLYPIGSVHCSFTDQKQRDAFLNYNKGDVISINCKISNIGELLGYYADIYDILDANETMSTNNSNTGESFSSSINNTSTFANISGEYDIFDPSISINLETYDQTTYFLTYICNTTGKFLTGMSATIPVDSYPHAWSLTFVVEDFYPESAGYSGYIEILYEENIGLGPGNETISLNSKLNCAGDTNGEYIYLTKFE